ncbi:hypothetical protein [Nonomuraea polychroma]|uniref:hypothetical protein n=1 Tax=Nonomuraea polychroma TaxID=46176 RepID=UPI000FDCEE21|nr:hypothetical protein [Nonomuraea polychroma]
MTTSEATAESRPWTHGDVVLAAGLVMVAVQLVWKFDLVRRSYFRQDDFTFIARGLEHGLTWDYLMRVDYGHLVPGPFAIQWAMGRLGVYNDVLAHAVAMTLLGAAGLALLQLLRLLFGSRPAILVPLAFYLLTPMTISSLSWWAVVIETLPFQIALPMALSSHVHYARTGRFRHALAAAAWTAVGMAFFVKAPFILVLAFALSVGWLRRPRQWPAWALYAGVVVVYAVIFFRQLFTSEQLTDNTVQPNMPSLPVAARFAWTLLWGSLSPAAFGGPWKWHPIGDDYAIAATPPPLAWVALGLAAVVVAASIRYRRRAWLAWLVLLGYVVLADMVPVLIGRVEQLGPELGGYELRYISSTSTVLALVIGLAFIPLRDEEQPWLRPPPRLRLAWAPLAAAVAAGSIWSVTAYGNLPLGQHVKSYVETARVALKRTPPGTVILDTYVPPKVVMATFFYEYALTSKVLGPIATHPVTWTGRLNGPVSGPLAFDEQGRLRPVSIEGAVVPGRSPCMPVGPAEVRFRLPLTLPKGVWTAQIGYLNPVETTLSVRLGGPETRVTAGKDLGSTYAAVAGGGTYLVLRTLDGRSACVGEIRVGVPRPAMNATSIPPRPVGG